ncbi:MAG: NADH-ubiquinone oxidoreductase-F iron-sulfur binding region domain-containing protein [Candidatus Eisenbacteria bacterium]
MSRGTGWIRNLSLPVEAGGGTAQDLNRKLLSITKNMMGTTICVLADAAAMPTESFLKKFRREFEAHAGAGRCPIRGASSHFLTAAH